MVISSTQTNVSVNNVKNSGSFTATSDPHFFLELSRNLYKNPIRAIIRELLCNAIDANTEAKVDNDVILHLPTSMDSTFSIEDNGVGMSANTIINVYTVYGKSTKSGENDSIGGFGLGSKTPFAYTKQLVVESSKDGIKNTYVFYLNEEGTPSYTLVNSEMCEKSGTKISFNVKKEDFDAFYEEAYFVCLFIKKMPTITGDTWKFYNNDGRGYYFGNNEKEFLKSREILLKEGVTEITVPRDMRTIIVNMGGVPYFVDPADLNLENIIDELNRYFYQSAIIFNFDIGSLSIQQSREQLNLIKETKAKISNRVKNFYVEKILEDFKIA